MKTLLMPKSYRALWGRYTKRGAGLEMKIGGGLSAAGKSIQGKGPLALRLPLHSSVLFTRHFPGFFYPPTFPAAALKAPQIL
jgi:hypothetical protein